jgi:hypothetical protein
MKTQLCLTALCLILICANSARAWNDTGHMTSAWIAWQELKPGAREKITALLKSHPRYEKDLLQGMPDGFADPALYAFMKAATWPDMVRSLSNPMSRTQHHGNWHYVDFPYILEADQQTIHPRTPEESGGQVDNLLKALPKAIAELRDPQMAGGEKAIRLCWVVHLIGDVHQPLHAISLFSQTYPNGDKGGNLIMVSRSGGELINLHTLWDGLLGPEGTPRAVELISRNILANPNHQRPALATQMVEHNTYKSWAIESFEDAREFVYLEGKLRGVKPSAATQPSAAPTLPISYEDVARQVARQRIALAGHRLADQLNALFE